MKTPLAAVCALFPLTLSAAEPPVLVPNIRLPEVTVASPKAPVFHFTPVPLPAAPGVKSEPELKLPPAPAPKSRIYLPPGKTAPMPIKEPDPAIDPKMIVRVPVAPVDRAR